MLHVIDILIRLYLMNTIAKQTKIIFPQVRGKIHRRSLIPWEIVPGKCKGKHVNRKLAFCKMITS